MYDFLKFIDSLDIREYNKNTVFTPAEQAVLISMSYKTTVEEKIEAFQYLADHYTEEEFKKDSIKCDWSDGDGGVPIRDVVLETIRIWKCALDARYDNNSAVFLAELWEKEYRGDSCRREYFSSYDKAYEYLVKEKKYYTDEVDVDYDEPIILYGIIKRVKVDTEDTTDGEYYYFDHDLQLVSLVDDEERKDDVPYLLDEYLAFVPLPFKKGDIVKVESLHDHTYYGVVSHDWKKPEDPERIIMWISLEMYIKEDNGFDYFDYTDGTGDCVLGYSFCPYEELPEDEKMLKLISDVRKDELDFYVLLHQYSIHRLVQLLEWQTR